MPENARVHAMIVRFSDIHAHAFAKKDCGGGGGARLKKVGTLCAGSGRRNSGIRYEKISTLTFSRIVVARLSDCFSTYSATALA